jgi:MFS family permease
VPFSIFKIPGLAAADVTQVIANAGFCALFFFVTLYMQSVLGFSPIIAGAAYIPVTMAVGMSAGISTKLLPRIGARPIIVAGTLIGSVGLVILSRIPIHGTYVTDILPGLVVMAFGLGGVLVGVQNAANADVPQDKAGLAAALISTSSTLGGALGLAVFSAIATGHTNHLLSHHVSRATALTGGFHYALFTAAVFLLAASLIATRTSKIRGVEQQVSEEATETLVQIAA